MRLTWDALASEGMCGTHDENAPSMYVGITGRPCDAAMLLPGAL